MITHIEIDGFKSFRDFTLDVPPLLVLVGPNASGKSNLLDALCLVADVVRLGPERALLSQRRGGAQDLFRRRADGAAVSSARISVGMIIGSRHGPLASSCHVELAHVDGVPQVRRSSTQVGPLKSAISIGGRPDLSWPRPAGISKEIVEELERAFRARTAAIDEAPQREHEDPVPGECESWPPLVLDPARMREPVKAPDDRRLERDGGNLAAVLHRLAEREVLWRVEADLAALIPGAVEIKTLFDERRQEYDFDVVFSDTGRVLPRLLSDGTLRMLAILAAAHDPDHAGVLAVEEVENGLHPGRVAELVRRLTRDLPDFSADHLPKPLRQVILTTHSPALVSALWPDRAGSIVFMETATHLDGAGQERSHVTRALPVAEEGEPGTFASPWDVERFLATVRQRPEP